MGLETGVTYIEDLVATNPNETDSDTLDEADNHMRIIKTAVQGSFPNLGAAAVTKTAAQINDLATKTGAETFTNKTITLPTIDDSSSNEVLTFAETASAVNNLQIKNVATGAYPQILAQGEANTGIFVLDSNGNEIVQFLSVTSAINYIGLSNSATTVEISALGAGTNINILLTPKGSGTVTLPADCITATQIATDAVDSDEIAADAVGASELSNANTYTTRAFVGSEVWTLSAGRYMIVPDADFLIEMRDTGTTWYTVTGSYIQSDGATIRITNLIAGARTLRYRAVG